MGLLAARNMSSSVLLHVFVWANMIMCISCEISEELNLSETDGTAVLSRPRRFAAIGYLTVILILLNTVLLIISNVVINK